MTAPAVAVVGAGRVGLSLARALVASGREVTVLGREDSDWASAIATTSIVLLTVPDDALEMVADRLVASGAITAAHVVLHTAGSRNRGALAALDGTGAALGSVHPLQSFSDPAGSPALLRGCPAIVEGDARAIDAAEVLARRLEMAPVLRVTGEAKARYHAAAVLVSNYLVVLADMATRLAEDAGLESDTSLFAPLMRQTVAALESGDPASVLTGPIRRGDAATVARHIAALDGEALEVYRVLGRATLALATRAGLDAEQAKRLRMALVSGGNR
ncbi:MAG TPA: DUF2520 domain-containing protein [Gemmatimonadales bacterium]|nr:DUF2520 domain-containing protein [Gemmatimonadales bacterium]